MLSEISLILSLGVRLYIKPVLLEKSEEYVITPLGTINLIIKKAKAKTQQ